MIEKDAIVVRHQEAYNRHRNNAAEIDNRAKMAGRELTDDEYRNFCDQLNSAEISKDLVEYYGGRIPTEN